MNALLKIFASRTMLVVYNTLGNKAKVILTLLELAISEKNKIK